MAYRNDPEPFDDAEDGDEFATDEQFQQMQQLIADVVMLGLNEGQPTESGEVPAAIAWYRTLAETERGYVEDMLRSAVATALAAVQGAMSGEDEDLEVIELDPVMVLEALRDYDERRPPYLDLATATIMTGQAEDPPVLFDEEDLPAQVRLPEISDDMYTEWMREFLESESRAARKAGLRMLEKSNGLTRCVEELAQNHPDSYDGWLDYQVDRMLEEVAGCLENIGYWPDFEAADRAGDN